MDTDAIVLAYLKRKQYERAEAALNHEGRVESLDDLAFRAYSAVDTNVANYILFHNPKEGPQAYLESYARLKDWITTSLEAYRDELSAILFPVFVHCYLDLVSKEHAEEAKTFLARFSPEHAAAHSADLAQLGSVTHKQHVLQNKLSSTFRTNKYNVRLSSYGFELLVRFLQEADFMLLLAIVNERINVLVAEAKPNDGVVPRFAAGALTGLSVEAMDELVEAHQVHWGTFPSFKESTHALISEFSEELKGLTDDEGRPLVFNLFTEAQAELDASFAAAAEEGAGRSKRRKRGDGSAAETGDAPPVPELKRIPLLETAELSELESFAEVRSRMALSSTALPSAAMYTFFNTYDTLNCASFSRSGGLMATGFGDSSIRLWDLEGRHLTGLNPELVPIAENSVVLHGHSGPVYGLSFSPDSRFFVSASQDGTARLWSMETRTNLVVYSGHSFPIWDVAVSPLGHYFATASHDTTARLWSTNMVTPLRIFAGHLSDVDTVAFHPNSNYVATGSSDKSVRLWDVQSGNCVRVYTGHTDGVASLAFSPDGAKLASGAHNGAVIEWDINSAKSLKSYTGHKGAVWSLDYAHDGVLLASASADHSIRLWDVESRFLDASTSRRQDTPPGGLVKAFYTKSTPVFNVKFNPRNVLLAAGPFRASEPSPHVDDLSPAAKAQAVGDAGAAISMDTTK
ncbi:transcription initiation factor TFIID subunit 5 [Thecamonas trahens ATCC 50062]|uniref:Transcription initiation factor TFIID subunit 5 n=1 Tax=Thecamonas trahens ATCC 50062 TaxID=461836 RepID=A0A0L0DLT8_THETB|nr:transcription initiation factor TFIID subunit 5 [Thecamonas trahens ATCC 50062]KNC53215.1 transcription initiation factor TFIID subunit 5 [Thecamonas trahens ATCC 50062]|eukprot:XP_013754684.1 transcription initiation factor TFIID subunit 5 [Thecamonas trahens ATCC 50062]